MTDAITPGQDDERLRLVVESIHNKHFAYNSEPGPTPRSAWEEYEKAVGELARRGWRVQFVTQIVLERYPNHKETTT